MYEAPPISFISNLEDNQAFTFANVTLSLEAMRISSTYKDSNTKLPPSTLVYAMVTFRH
jgi:hypothetical protein